MCEINHNTIKSELQKTIDIFLDKLKIQYHSYQKADKEFIAQILLELYTENLFKAKMNFAQDKKSIQYSMLLLGEETERFKKNLLWEMDKC